MNLQCKISNFSRKKYSLVLFFFLLQVNVSIAQTPTNIREYFAIIQLANNALLDQNGQDAAAFFHQAFDNNPFPFGCDVINALELSLQIDDTALFKKSLSKIFLLGVPKTFIEKKCEYFISRHSLQNFVDVTFDKYYKLYYQKNVTDLIDSLVLIDQKINCAPEQKYGSNNYTNTIELKDPKATIIELFSDIKNFSEYRIGIFSDKEEKMRKVPKYSVLFTHLYKSSFKLDTNSVSDAINNGYLNPNLFVSWSENFMNCGRHYFVINDSCNLYEAIPNFINDTNKISQNRKSLGLSVFADYKAAVIKFSQKDYSPYFFWDTPVRYRRSTIQKAHFKWIGPVFNSLCN